MASNAYQCFKDTDPSGVYMNYKILSFIIIKMKFFIYSGSEIRFNLYKEKTPHRCKPCLADCAPSTVRECAYRHWPSGCQLSAPSLRQPRRACANHAAYRAVGNFLRLRARNDIYLAK